MYSLIKSSTNRGEVPVCDPGKLIQDRILNVEKHFAELCSTFATYTRKAARLRDINDELSQVLLNYVDSETINTSTNACIEKFAGILHSLGSFSDVRVQKLDNKIVTELSQYEVICKHAKEEVKFTLAAREKEANKRRTLERLREKNPHNRQQISQAETELVKANTELARTVKTLDEQINQFERQKLLNLKSILLNFINIEIRYHAKSLEFLTKGYKHIENIDEQADLEEFQNSVRISLEKLSRLETVKRISASNKQSYSMSSLNTPHVVKHSSTHSKPLAEKPISKSMESMDSYKVRFEETTEKSSSDDDYTESVQLPVATRRVI